MIRAIATTHLGTGSRWVLTIVLLLSAATFAVLPPPIEGEPTSFRAAQSGLFAFCLISVAAVWGHHPARRIIAGSIALLTLFNVMDECFINFDGNWGFSGRRSESTPFNALLAFLFFGIPCLIYTLLGRISLRKPPSP